MNSLKKSMTEIIKSKLATNFTPSHLELINESYKHKVPKDAETHFKLVIVSNKFENITSLVEKHQMVYKVLAEEFNNGLHALSLVTKTENEWKNGNVIETAKIACKGSNKIKPLSNNNQ